MTEWVDWSLSLLGGAAALGTAWAALHSYGRGEFGRALRALALGGLATAALMWPREIADLVLGTDAPTRSTPSDDPTEGGALVPAWVLWTALGLGATAAVAVPAATLGNRHRRRTATLRERATAQLSRRQAIEADHDEVTQAYGEYVCDVLAFLDRPTLDDVTVPQTAALLHAMDAASDARRGDDLAAYRAAVSALKIAWRAADEHARKTGTRHVPHPERAAVAKARGLLEIALDESGGEHERQAAYIKARALLDGVLVIPRQAAAELETRNRLTLTAKAEGA
ncbi:hypothetical protein ACFVGY_30715 [Streptomyces sp. NPDC127106]|uniref:hypothetical protein n=1 Tax=Streptomyces sp. NPDC127106 TaxID=3345360 RepID=UPI00362DAA11